MTNDEVAQLLRDRAYGVLFHGSPDPIAAFDPTGRLIDANAATIGLLDMSLEEYAKYPFASFVAEDHREHVRNEFALAVEHGLRVVDTQADIPSGARLDIRLVLVPFAHEGVVVAVLVATSNLREVVIAREEQAASQRQFTDLVNSMSDGLFLIDRNWILRYVNPRGEAMVKRPAHEIIGKRVWDEFPGLYGSEFGIAARRARAEGISVRSRADFADLGWIEITAHNTSDDEIAVYARDVALEESARRELVESQRQLAAQAALLDVAHDAIVVCDLEHRIRYWNQAASRMYGWTSAEIVGSSLRQLLYREAGQFDEATSTTLANGFWSGELSGATRSGETLIAESSWTLVLDSNGLAESILSVSTNITERKRQEAVMMRTQRLDSLGTFASGIAHDLNNVLTPILMSAQVLGYDETDPHRKEMLTAIESGAARGADMIRQVLSFARGTDAQRYRVDIARLMSEFESLCRSSFPSSIHITNDVAPEQLFVAGDPTQLLQLLLNLAGNARDAMPGGGRLQLSARAEYLSEAVTAPAGASAGAYVVIDVTDTGLGMPPETVARIFEPFFTTKPAGSGTGIGLATSAAIVRGHGGFIRVESSPGSGSRFCVSLPVSTGSVVEAPMDPQLGLQRPTSGAGELILIVDDEAAIRTATTLALEGFGYTTAVCANAGDALEFLEQEPGRVDLILTDVTMPGMSGIELAATLARGGSTIPVIAMSGLSDPSLANDSESGIVGVLAKPFSTLGVLDSVFRALHREVGHRV